MRMLTRHRTGEDAVEADAGQQDTERRRGLRRKGGRAGSGKRRKDSAQEGQPPGGGKRKHVILGRHPILAVIAIVVTATVTGAALTAYAAYRNVLDSIHRVNVSSKMLGPRPPKLNNSLNILLIGSDSRAGTHGQYGRGIQGSRSDTSMILHISPVHKKAIVISFPRDSMVQQYQCFADGQGHPGQQAGAPGVLEMLNATYSYGGAACLWKTLEQTTHIHIDHFVEVNFTSFKQIVNDIGGVPVCLPKAIHDPASKLRLKAGMHIVTGAQALAFVRLRHIGQGSDLQRIQRQQYFLAAAAQKIKHSSILANPAQLYHVVHDVANALTTDSQLSLTDMLAIANSLKSVSTKSLRFLTVPVTTYLPAPNQVIWMQPQANHLFAAIRHDNERAAQKAGKAKAPPVATVRPAKVHVRVLNGTNTTGLAAGTAAGLTAKGFHVTRTGNAPVTPTSVIEYGSASQAAEAATLQNEIPGAQVKQVHGVKAGTLTLVLGTSFHGLHKHKPKPGGSSGPKIGKSYGGITGNANICGDSSAFAGTDTPSMFTP
jgi:LCP family protein required for cell wall assembly